MSVINRVRGCDQFGAPISLNFDGKTSYNTLGGGIASLCLRALILSYLAMQLLAVFNYDDPTISSFTIIEDRTKMKEPMSLGDYNVDIAFFFMSNKGASPVQLDPNIGRFRAF